MRWLTGLWRPIWGIPLSKHGKDFHYFSRKFGRYKLSVILDKHNRFQVAKRDFVGWKGQVQQVCQFPDGEYKRLRARTFSWSFRKWELTYILWKWVAHNSGSEIATKMIPLHFYTLRELQAAGMVDLNNDSINAVLHSHVKIN